MTFPLARLHGALMGTALLMGAACATPPRRFPLRAPLWRDTDLQSVSVRCHSEPTPKDPRHVACAPAVDPSPTIWDGADNLFFRPLSETLGVVARGESIDVNSLDEVPDSSWFTNRIGVRALTAGEVELGACPASLLLDGANAADGSWVIDKGKGEGSTDGFRVVVPGRGKYLFKADDADTPEHSSAAETLGARVYYAAGYYTTCEQVVYFRRSALKLTPGLRWKHNFGDEEDFGPAELEKVLAHCARKGDLIRMQASAWLSGQNIGGYQYEGTRVDDPNDVVAHDDRRELRAKRLLDAWIDRFDDRRGNTIDMWIADRPGPPDTSPGHVIHYQTDTSEALGSEWAWEPISRRLGYSYVLDWRDVTVDLFTAGARLETWDTVRKTPGKAFFAYFNVADFVPEDWKNEYPVAAFSRMTERDGAWMARILAHFDSSTVEVLSRTAQFSDPRDADYLDRVLEGRLRKILERYLTVLSPIAEIHLESGQTEYLLCGTDLAEVRALRAPRVFRYSARRLGGGGWLKVERRPGGGICVELPSAAPERGSVDDDPSRYVRVRIEDGVARGPLVAHLYDLGPTRGWRLAGLERPEP
jgi:hypothetical protein